ncbi:MAG: ATP-binding protein [Xanthomonadales bacterium]|nr:ATP-binding protein [Xanthomonadales bacterium]
MGQQPLAPERLRWICKSDRLDFETTEQVPELRGIIGQELAVEALEFGLDCQAPNQNIFVRGISGTGRMTLVRDVLSEMDPVCRNKLDRCYLHNFTQADRPRLVSLPKGQGRVLRRRLHQLAEFVTKSLGDAMNAKPLQASRTAIQEETQRRIDALTEPFEEELSKKSLALVQVQTPHGAQAAIFPTFQGQPIPPEQLDQLIEGGELDPKDRAAFEEARDGFARRLPELTTEIGRIQREGARRIEAFNDRNLRRLVSDLTEPLKQDFNNERLSVFLDEVLDDIVEQALRGGNDGYDPFVRYGVNILFEHLSDESPVVVESSPTLANLLGTIESQWNSAGQASADYRGIRGGALLRADGGFLILDARDVLAEPGAWRILIRTLRTGQLEIVPREFNAPFGGASLKPEPIPIRVRVVLLGSDEIYYQLDRFDPDFSELFKVLADFSEVVDRSDESIWQYATFVSRLAAAEKLRHFTADGVAALTEHGARIAGTAGKLTTRFGRVADIVREASWLAGHRGDEVVGRDHVVETVRRTKRRASLPSQEFQAYLKDGTIRIDTSGTQIGQINGLAVMSAGPLTYGFPARITATVGPGTDGIIDIEGQASMSGSIHTKGFHILNGLLRYLLHAEHPLTLTASLAFEQSYGGIDGDSASGAEICCLLSALTGVPIRQGLAITGAVDQHGALQAIGGVNEKIEGFYDICDHFELDGDQGVIIPAANAGDLMLRHDVVEACREGRFQVYAVENLVDALELLTGTPAGCWDSDRQAYPDGSILAVARAKAEQYWRETRRIPGQDGPG